MTAATHMLSAYLIVTILAAAANVYAATSDFRSPAWLLSNMKRLGVQKRWLTTLGTLKALGALGLLAGIRIPLIGVAAAAGLVLFFVGAIITVMRTRWYAHCLIRSCGSCSLLALWFYDCAQPKHDHIGLEPDLQGSWSDAG